MSFKNIFDQLFKSRDRQIYEDDELRKYYSQKSSAHRHGISIYTLKGILAKERRERGLSNTTKEKQNVL
jgi:hypothetical protein